MSRKKKNEGYRGVMEGDKEADGSDAAVRAGEDRKGSTRGTERRIEVGEHSGDKKLRARLAEVLSSAGVDDKRVAVEVLYLLPEEFVRGYTDLFHRALATGEDGTGEKNDAKAELGKARGKAARNTLGGTRGVWQIRNDRALGEKQRIDRQLRKLARQMRDGANAGTGKEQVARCGEFLAEEKTGCGKWVEKGWKFCPACGVEQRVGPARS